MPLNAYDLAAVSGRQGALRWMIEILAQRTANPSEWYWCDINKPDRAWLLDQDWFSRRLVTPPKITRTSEQMPGRVAWTITDLIVDDDDNRFGYPCTAENPWLLASYAVTGEVYFCQLESWQGALVRVRVAERVTSASADTLHSLGVWSIEDIVRSDQREPDPRKPGHGIYRARIKLATLSKMLKDVSARDVRRGDTWLQNMPMPKVIAELIETGSNGRFVASSGIPSSITPTGTKQPYFSVVGNIPVLRPADQSWNERRDFVPRYQFMSGTAHYFLGYSVPDNCPAVRKLDMLTGSWSQPAIGDITQFPGYEAVFGYVSGTNLYMFCLSNTSATGTGQGNNMRNCALRIARIPSALTGVYAIWGPYAIWPMGMAATRPANSSPSGHWCYGSVNGWAPDKHNHAVPFGQNVSSPGLDGSGYTPLWISWQDEADEWQPLHTEELLVSQNPGDCHNAAFGYIHHSGYSSGITLTYGTGPAHWPVLSHYHADAFESFRYHAGRNAVYWMFFDESAGVRWNLARFDLDTFAYATQVVYFGTYDNSADSFWEDCVTAFDIYSEGAVNKLWIATERTDVVDAYHNAESAHLWYHATFPETGTLNAFTALHTTFPAIAWDTGRKWGPSLISMRVSNSGVCVSGVMCNRYAAGANCYGIWVYAGTLTNMIGYDARARSAIPVSTMPFSLSAVVSDKIYALDQATGRVWLVYPAAIVTGFMEPATMLSRGQAIDSENTWASCNLLHSPAHNALFGVSASGPAADTQEQIRTGAMWGTSTPQLGQNTPSGRMSFFQWSYALGGVVGLADFGDEDCWDSLEMCRAWCGDYILGFDRDPDVTVPTNPRPQIYIKPRTVATPSITIVKSGTDPHPAGGLWIPCERITTHLDAAGVVNKFNIPVYTGERAGPEVTIVLSGDPTGRVVANATAHQTSNSAQTILLRALRDSAPTTSGYTGGALPLLFSWSRTNDEITTSLSAAAAPAANTLYVRGLYQDGSGQYRIGNAIIRVGDFITAGDEALTNISAINVSAGSITMSPPLGNDATLPIGTTVKIAPKSAGRFADSEEGICTTDAAYTLPVGGAISTITVDSTANLSPGMVLYRDTAYFQVVGISSATTALLKGPMIGSGTGRDATWSSGTVLRGALYVEAAGRAYGIGGTGVSVAILPRANDSHKLGEWKAGDIIRIRCKGLEAKRENNIIISARDSASIERYRMEKDWKPIVENRLMDQARAEVFLEDASELAIAPFITVCHNAPALVGIDVGDVFWILSARLWPAADALLGIDALHRVAHAVTGIEHDGASGLMTLTCRSFLVAGRADEVGARTPSQVSEGLERRRV